MGWDVGVQILANQNWLLCNYCLAPYLSEKRILQGNILYSGLRWLSVIPLTFHFHEKSSKVTHFRQYVTMFTFRNHIDLTYMIWSMHCYTAAWASDQSK